MVAEELQKKLLPCAHCGNKIPEVFHLDYIGDNYVGDEYLIECSCGIGSVTFDKADKIINDWNRRIIFGEDLKELIQLCQNLIKNAKLFNILYFSLLITSILCDHQSSSIAFTTIL